MENILLQIHLRTLSILFSLIQVCFSDNSQIFFRCVFQSAFLRNYLQVVVESLPELIRLTLVLLIGLSILNRVYSARVEDGSFVKLKNIAFGYHVPLKGAVLNSIASIRIYAQATNLFTITKYTGSDPEISINGNSINSGKDQNVPPNARVFTLGVNVGF